LATLVSPTGAASKSVSSSPEGGGDRLDENNLYRAALDIADAIVRADPMWPRQLVGMLADEVGADTVGFASWPRGRFSQTQSENVGGPALTDDERRIWPEHFGEYPFFRNLQRGELHAVRTSDFFTSICQFHRTAVYQELLAPRDARFQLNFGLLDDTELAIIGAYRQNHDFTDDELRILERARAPLSAALRYRYAADQLEGRLDALPREPARSRIHLTPREQQVLSLVSGGSTNRQVARRLEITDRTVRKHLEDIYRRLDVTNRVAASRWWIETSALR